MICATAIKIRTATSRSRTTGIQTCTAGIKNGVGVVRLCTVVLSDHAPGRCVRLRRCQRWKWELACGVVLLVAFVRCHESSLPRGSDNTRVK